MAPSKAARVAVVTVQGDDPTKPTPEAPAKEKETHPTTKPHANGKQRQTGSGSGPKASAVAADKTSTAAAGKAHPPKGVDSNAHTLRWTSFNREILHTYRRHYRLDTPTAFSKSYHHSILALSGGVGKHSPTMAHRNRAAGPTRQTKEHLALAIRKHFNGLSVVENDVIVNFIHKIRQDDSEAAKRRLTRRDTDRS